MLESINPWTTIFLFIASQGFFLSFLIYLRKSPKLKNSFFLGSFIAVFSIILIFWVGFWNDFNMKTPLFELYFFPIPFLLGPLIWLHIKSYFQYIKLPDTFHFLPFVIAILHSVFIFFDLKDENFLYWDSQSIRFIYYLLQGISFLLYGIFVLRFLNKRSKLEKLSHIEILQLKLTAIFFNLFSVISIFNFLLNRVIDIPVFLDFILAILVSILIYLIGYLGLNSASTIKVIQKTPIGLYTKSSLQPDKVDSMIQKIVNHLEEEKPYLECDYKLNDLAKKTNIPQHQISEILNKYLNQSFAQLINSYRVNEAKKMLISKDYRKIKIESIGYEAGFNSKTTFYSWFKEIEKTTPSSFQKNAQKHIK